MAHETCTHGHSPALCYSCETGQGDKADCHPGMTAVGTYRGRALCEPCYRTDD